MRLHSGTVSIGCTGIGVAILLALVSVFRNFQALFRRTFLSFGSLRSKDRRDPKERKVRRNRAWKFLSISTCLNMACIFLDRAFFLWTGMEELSQVTKNHRVVRIEICKLKIIPGISISIKIEMWEKLKSRKLILMQR